MKEGLDCSHYYGVRFTDLDCPHWLLYLDAQMIGEAPARKITIEYTGGHEQEDEADRLDGPDDDVAEAA